LDHELLHEELASRKVKATAIEFALLTFVPCLNVGFELPIPVEWSDRIDFEPKHLTDHFFTELNVAYVGVDGSKAFLHVVLPFFQRFRMCLAQQVPVRRQKFALMSGLIGTKFLIQKRD
jgi:hypothetical protein